MKRLILLSLPVFLYSSWDTWWDNPPTLAYYKVRSSNSAYTKYDRIFIREGKRWGISPIFLKAIATQETGLNSKLRDSSNRDGSVDIGLMRINNIHQDELWSWKRWTLSDMRNDSNKAVYFAAKVLKRCIRNYGLYLNDYDKLANTFSCYNGSQRFYSKEKGKVVGDPNLIYGKKILYHIVMYQKVGTPLVDGSPIAYNDDFSSIENKNSKMDNSMVLNIISNISVKKLNNSDLLKHTFPWKIRME